MRRCRLPVPAPGVRAAARRAPRDALRDRARRGRAGAQRHARRRRRARARLDRLPRRGSSTRRTTSPRCCATATTCSARSSATAGTPASSASTRGGAGNHYGTRPELLCELHLEHEDGSVEVVATDARWRATTGPIVYSDLLMGERYDARRELGAWSRRASRRAWRACATGATTSRLVPERCAADARHRGAAPGRGHRARAGRARRRPRPEHGRLGPPRGRGRARDAVELRFAEMLEPDGSLLPGQPAQRAAARHLRAARRRASRCTSRASPSTASATSRSPAPATPEPEAITGCVVHSDTPRSGSFECSDELVNQLWRNINWGQRGNFLSVPTDCPQRDERLGWLADAQVFLPTATLNMDVAAFITKWGDDVLDAQSPEGAYPDVAPRLVARARRRAGVGRRRGDRAVDRCGAATATVRLVERHWDAMERYMALPAAPQPGPAVDGAARQRLRRLARGRRARRRATCSPPRTGPTTRKLMAEMATVLGRPERAEHYERLRAGIVAAFNRAYVGEDAYIEGDTQTVYLLALHMDLLPEPSCGARGGRAARREHRAPRRPPHHGLRRRRACCARC